MTNLERALNRVNLNTYESILVFALTFDNSVNYFEAIEYALCCVDDFWLGVPLSEFYKS